MNQKTKRIKTAEAEIKALRANLIWALEGGIRQDPQTCDKFCKVARNNLARVQGMIVRLSMGNYDDSDWDMYDQLNAYKLEPTGSEQT